jgi:hypothetical protein
MDQRNRRSRQFQGRGRTRPTELRNATDQKVRGSNPFGRTAVSRHYLCSSNFWWTACAMRVSWLRRQPELVNPVTITGSTCGSRLSVLARTAGAADSFGGSGRVHRALCLIFFRSFRAAARMRRAVALAARRWERGSTLGVGVGGHDDAGVAELVLDDLQVGASGVRQACRAVAQVVESDRWQSGPFDQHAHPLGQIRSPRSTVAHPCVHQPGAAGAPEGCP